MKWVYSLCLNLLLCGCTVSHHPAEQAVQTAAPMHQNLAEDQPKMEKQFKLKKEEIKPLAINYGGCIASDKITVEGLPVRFMYREKPVNLQDSGWVFLSGTESDEYMDDTKNHSVYDVNTIANHDPSIIPLLKSPIGSVFEKIPEATEFEAVTNWRP